MIFHGKQFQEKEHEAVIPFKVKSKGEISLEVIRECDKKDGYDEYLYFNAG